MPSHLAEQLGLDPVDGPELEWSGERNGLRMGLTQRAGLFGRTGDAQLYCVHEMPLRLGLLARTPTPSLLSDPLDEIPVTPIAIPDVERFELRAAEAEIAVDVLHSGRALVADLCSRGTISIDDQRLWLGLSGDLSRIDAREVADRMTTLSAHLTRRRSEWEAEFETAIGQVWSRLATHAGMRLHVDASRVEGHVAGASFELRVDGEPGRLFTEVYVEWPSLELGLYVVRREARGTLGQQPPDRHDVTSLRALFADTFDTTEPLEPRAIHGALRLASIGASLTIDDTGLVARIDHVATTGSEAHTLLHGAMEIAKGMLDVNGADGMYR